MTAFVDTVVFSGGLRNNALAELMPLTADITGPRESFQLFGYVTLLTTFGGGGGLPGGPRTVTGQVKDPDGVNVAGYTVRMYDQATGALMAETTSGVGGVFEFDQMDSREVYVVAIDNVADTWKAPIVDRITPSL